jgi:hypothetical protein
MRSINSVSNIVHQEFDKLEIYYLSNEKDGIPDELIMFKRMTILSREIDGRS